MLIQFASVHGKIQSGWCVQTLLCGRFDMQRSESKRCLACVDGTCCMFLFRLVIRELKRKAKTEEQSDEAWMMVGNISAEKEGTTQNCCVSDFRGQFTSARMNF